MKKMIMAMVLIASVFTAKAQSSFEIKADALFDEIETLASYGGEQQFNYTNLLALADAVRNDPNFASQWSNYLANEQQQRQTTPIECVGGTMSSYNSCMSYYLNSQLGVPPPAPPPPPGWSGSSYLNLCSYNLINAINQCLGLPVLY